MSEMVPMTRDAYNRKKKEVERMENEEMPVIAQKIAEARDEGDLKENAEYHAQREAQGMLQAKINQLKTQLANSVIINPEDIDHDKVGFGATVTVKDLDLEDVEEMTLVGAGDEDYDTGKYLLTSPIGQGLNGKKVGDTVEIPVPRGTLRFEILGIRYGE